MALDDDHVRLVVSPYRTGLERVSVAVGGSRVPKLATAVFNSPFERETSQVRVEVLVESHPVQTLKLEPLYEEGAVSLVERV